VLEEQDFKEKSCPTINRWSSAHCIWRDARSWKKRRCTI